MKCLNCGATEMVVVQETNGFSLAGVLAAFLFLVGLATLLAAPVIGLLVIITAVLIGVLGRGKTNYMVCLGCKDKTKI